MHNSFFLWGESNYVVGHISSRASMQIQETSWNGTMIIPYRFPRTPRNLLLTIFENCRKTFEWELWTMETRQFSEVYTLHGNIGSVHTKGFFLLVCKGWTCFRWSFVVAMLYMRDWRVPLSNVIFLQGLFHTSTFSLTGILDKFFLSSFWTRRLLTGNLAKRVIRSRDQVLLLRRLSVIGIRQFLNKEAWQGKPCQI